MRLSLSNGRWLLFTARFRKVGPALDDHVATCLCHCPFSLCKGIAQSLCHLVQLLLFRQSQRQPKVLDDLLGLLEA